MHRFRSSGCCIFSPFVLTTSLLLSISALQAQDKPAPSQNLKIGFLMDSLKVERWQTDLDKFQKRAGELGADVLIETAEGDDELQLQQAQKLLSAGVKSLVLVPHDAEKAVRIVRLLRNRLSLTELLQRYPEIESIPIEKPFIVVGMPPGRSSPAAGGAPCRVRGSCGAGRLSGRRPARRG